MANEIRATGNLQISKDGFTITGNNTKTITMEGTQYIGNIQSIGTSYEAVVIGDLSDVRYIYIYNQSDNEIQVSVNPDSQSYCQLLPKDVLLMPFSASVMPTIFLKADEAGSDVQIVAVEK